MNWNRIIPVKPHLIFSLFMILILNPSNILAQLEVKSKAQKAEEIITQYLEAIGGKNKLKQISSLTVKGKGQGGSYAITLPMTLYIKNPSKNKMEISIMNQKMVMATDGTLSWGVNPFLGNGQPRPMPSYGPSINNNVFYTIGKNLIDYQDRGYEAEYLGKTNFRGKKAYRVRLISDLSEDEYYIDVDTYFLLMAKVDYSKNYFGDYKKVGDIYFPHHLEGERGGFIMDVEEVIINEKIDDKEFEMPYAQFNAQENILLNQSIENETFDFTEKPWTPTEIIDKYTQVVGSPNQFNLKKKKSIRIEGKITLGKVEVPLTIWAKKDSKFRMEMKIMDHQAITASNGKESWEVSPFDGVTEPVPIDEEQINANSELLSFGREIIVYKEEGAETNYLGKTFVKGRESHVIELVTDNQRRFLYFFDTENYLLLLKHNRDTGEQEFYGDYQTLDDALIPYRVESYDPNENLYTKIKFEKFTFHVKIKDTIFDYPESE